MHKTWADQPGPHIGPAQRIPDHELVREYRKTIIDLKDEVNGLSLSLADAEEIITEQQALIRSLRAAIEMWSAK